MTPAFEPETLSTLALDWLTARAEDDGDGGLTWSERDFYNGTAGIIPAYLAAADHFGEDHYLETALRAARGLAATEDDENPTLFFGYTGIALVLRHIGERYGEETCAKAAERALDRLRDRFDGRRWTELFDLMSGNAGYALAALAFGDTDLAARALQPYVDEARTTDHGVNWLCREDDGYVMHHISHGTLGIVHALAQVGDALGRADFVELAVKGASDVSARNEQAPEGFLVPHSDPQFVPDQVSRYNYGWCHGPAGDAGVFAGLGRVTGDPRWTEIASRCWYTVLHSGVPRRVRPGFWDNNGRCCGTGAVLALACEREGTHGDALAFAETLFADLADRAIVDSTGARWSNHEYRAEVPDLEPATGWGAGNAGIVPELLRYARIRDGREPVPVFTLPGVA